MHENCIEYPKQPAITEVAFEMEFSVVPAYKLDMEHRQATPNADQDVHTGKIDTQTRKACAR